MSPFDCREEDSSALDQEVDDLCDRFEAAWRSGEKPDLRAWVPAAGPLRWAALVELACIDLEWRIGAGEPARVEHYLHSFPELQIETGALLRLVATEAGLRLGREAGLSTEDYRCRFPDLVDLSGWESAVPGQTGASGDNSSAEVTTDAPLAGTGSAAEAIGERLRLLSEIDRGGMGVVLRGRDDALGRDVAVKVLLEKHADKPEGVRRFLVEAQITGQLQHPAIVPVHDIGRLPDGRPYFTMKLIHGRKLMDLLNERTDPQQDRTRFLKVFEQVCQALAYAHSRGVIHRDLKPHNVMVGAFGEVQVLDWGLAKVLTGGPSCESTCPTCEDASAITPLSPAEFEVESRAGDLFGTLMYMSPEQARGEVEQQDERCDVFGLGAILCVILTGKPPHPGAVRSEILSRAERGDLADTFARLESSGADSEMIQLAKACLAPEKSSRPRHAGEVAQAMAAYQAGVEERLHRAELERAGAELKAAEERKRRKLQQRLAAALLLVVVGVGGAAWLWQATNASLLPQLEVVRQMREQAKKDPLGDAAKFREAAVAARHVEALAAKSVASFRVRREAAELAEELETEAGSSARDRRLLIALGEVHAPREGPRYSRDDKGMLLELAEPSVDEQFKTAFREWGVNVDRLPTEEAAALFRGRPVGVITEVVAALDEWASQRRQQQKVVAPWQNPANLAQALDLGTSSNRGELRAIVTRGNLHREYALSALAMSLRPVPVPFDAGLGADRTRLRKLVAATDATTEPVLGMLLMVRALRVGGNDDLAESLLRSALRARPREGVLHKALGKLLARQRRWQEAVEVYATLRGISPESGVNLAETLIEAGRIQEGFALFDRLRIERKDDPSILISHGKALIDQRRQKEAETVFREAIRLKRDYPEAHCGLGVALYDQRRQKEAETVFREAIRLKHDYSEAHCGLGVALVEQRRHKEAEAAFREAIRLKHDYSEARCGLGVALVEQGRHKEAEAACREAIRLKPDFPEAHSNLGLALNDQGRHKEAEAACREAIRLKHDYPEAHGGLGFALAQQGKLNEAEAAFRETIRLKPDFPLAHSNLGTALDQQGKLNEAEAAFREAIRLKPDYPKAHCNLGHVLAKQGRLKEAEAAFRETIRLKHDFPLAHYNLGNVLHGLGRHKEAEAVLREAIRLKHDYSEAHCNLGNVLHGLGRHKEAEAVLREAIRLMYDCPEAHCNLGLVLQAQGQFQAALASFRRGHELGSKQPGWAHPSGLLVSRCRRLVQLDRLLQRTLDGAGEPANAPQRLELAALCRHPSKRLHRTAAYFTAEAFSGSPKLADDLNQQHRYHAARSAALAATGQAEDARLIPDRIVFALHRQARTWLRADLARYAADRKRDPRFSKAVQQRLTHWQKDPDLAAVRDKDALRRLPEDERIAWRTLWDDVANLLKKVPHSGE